MERPQSHQTNASSLNVSNTYKLSEEQLRFYHDFGYLVIKRLIDFETLYNCKQRFIQICKGVVKKGHMTVMKELSLLNSGATGEDLINKIQDILFDDVLSTYFEYPKLLDVVSQFVGNNVTAVHSMLINKPPGTGRHPPHQDLHYFPFRPEDRIVASWTAIDHVTRENGCLYVLPGSHKLRKLYEHGYPPPTNGVINKMYHGILEEAAVAPEAKRLHLEMEPGDTVFFHPLLVHGSGPNVTKGYRKAISCHYAASECEYIDVEGTTHKPIADEIVAISRKRGYQLTFQDAIRYRSKVVRGVRCNL